VNVVNHDGSYCRAVLISFPATFAPPALPRVTLSDKDLCVLAKFSECDAQAVKTRLSMNMLLKLALSQLAYTGDHRVDHEALELKAAGANLSTQIYQNQNSTKPDS